ncbi:MAG: ABC transporter ATP-binding protein [Elusimicrobia bacterium]|nr:ABC transporter ATP-binding protein [Elusimicrobiota bacterium]
MSSPVSVSGLSYAYPAARGGNSRLALNHLSFDVSAGEMFGVLGPNGGGKSTLFKILATLLRPGSGRVRLFGQDTQAARGTRKRMGVVFQNPSLDLRLTCEENLLYQGRLYGLSGRDLARRVDDALGLYRLEDRRRDWAGSLSGGLRRRLELAKGLIHDPDLLLLDEPTVGLDPGARKELWDHLGRIRGSRKITILLTTHLMDEAERCDRLMLLHEGRLTAEGTPEVLKGEIGGDVITLETEQPDTLLAGVRERFQAEAARLGEHVRIERKQGHSFIPQLVEAFPGLIRSVHLSKPTLEDVFIHHTGRGFWNEGAQQESRGT